MREAWWALGRLVEISAQVVVRNPFRKERKCHQRQVARESTVPVLTGWFAIVNAS
jgi:hypothetical protein